MANDKIEGIIAQYLSMGDIARMRDAPTGGYLSTERQIHRLGPDNRDATRHLPLETAKGNIPMGVSEAYRDLRYDDFIGSDGFDNRPALPYYEPKTKEYMFFELDKPNKMNPDANMLELYMGEVLALQRKAEAGEASPEELELLDAYNEFFRTRTGG
jgi:hypothetical protein